MKIKNIEKKAASLGYAVNRTETPIIGMRANLIRVKGKIENRRYYMRWEAIAEGHENLEELESSMIILSNKKDPDDIMTDYFTTEFYGTIKHAFLAFER
jgi:hypothetical protein